MILVIGGAYQGKLDYVLEKHTNNAVFQCDARNPDIDFSAGIINGLHLAILAQLRAGTDTMEYLLKRLSELQSKVVICDDISCGVVPIDSEMRRWRETTGRCLALLSKNADEVIRVFCGIGSRIK